MRKGVKNLTLLYKAICVLYNIYKMKKKKKEEFREFRNNEKSAYKTFKISLKTILLNCDTILPVINNLVFEMNDLVIHTYQFIRLYVLNCYTNNQPLPTLDETFILYCIKSLGIRDNRGKKVRIPNYWKN